MLRGAKITLVGLVTFLVGLLSLAQAEDDSTYKAGFIVKLFDYVQWPAGSGIDSNGSAVIGVLGDCPLVAPLKAAAAEKSAGGKLLTVKIVTMTDPLSDCDILLIPTTDKTELAKIMKKLATAPVVTVSDCTGFAGFGVMVNFYKDDASGKVKFEINTLAAGDAKLKFSSQLLKLAKVI